MPESQPGIASHAPTKRGFAARPWSWLRSSIPFMITVVLSIALTLLVQMALPVHPDVPASAAPWRSPAGPAGPVRQPLPLPSTVLTMTEGTTLTDTLILELTRQRAEISRLWSAYYLARAANQLADAEAALRINDLSEVEQVLTTVDASLDRAYERSAEQEKGPINEFRTQVSRIHEDLRIRPEGMDQRLRRLRQSMLSLVDEGN